MSNPFCNPLVGNYPNNIISDSIPLTIENLQYAYAKGIFPWPQQDGKVFWICPENRGVIPTASFYVNTNSLKFLKRSNFKIRFNQNFSTIVELCRKTLRPGQNFSWITNEVEAVYAELFKTGQAYCIGCYENDQLIGGIYGVNAFGSCSVESSFHLKSNASKACLLALRNLLYRNGKKFIDVQILTNFCKKASIKK